MPDLTTRVAAWREAIAPLFLGREDVLDELEGHLWDEIDRRTRAGDGPEVAFAVATAKLGAPAEIASEFSKVPVVPQPWLPVRLAWVTAAVSVIGAISMLKPRFERGGLDSLLAGHMGGVLLGYLASLLVSGLAACFLVARLVREPRPGQRTTLRSAATLLTGAAFVLTLSGVALGISCPLEKTGWCWGLDTREVGGIGIAVWNALLLAYLWAGRRSPRIQIPMLLGSVGGAVVVLGWFAAARVEQHSYGLLTAAPMIALLAIGWAGIGLTALVPAGCLRLRRA